MPPPAPPSAELFFLAQSGVFISRIFYVAFPAFGDIFPSFSAAITAPALLHEGALLSIYLHLPIYARIHDKDTQDHRREKLYRAKSSIVNPGVSARNPFATSKKLRRASRMPTTFAFPVTAPVSSLGKSFVISVDFPTQTRRKLDVDGDGDAERT